MTQNNYNNNNYYTYLIIIAMTMIDNTSMMSANTNTFTETNTATRFVEDEESIVEREKRLVHFIITHFNNFIMPLTI